MQAPDNRQAADQVLIWRRGERERLIGARLAIAADTRAGMGKAIADRLDEALGDCRGRVVSLYWPFRGEPDLRPWMDRLTQAGAICLLPIVVEKAKPLIFRSWKQGEPLTRGVWNIPIPEKGEEMRPEIIIAPLVGFDGSSYRLGYGGGFFDRTLAGLEKPFTAVGVGYSSQEMATIRPLPHDIPMDIIVTETHTRHRARS